MSTTETEFRFRRGTAAKLAQRNLVFGPGEPIYETDTNRFKICDGVTPWNDLPYVAGGTSTDPGGGVDPTDLLAHINSDTPHPIYDDGPSLVLLYENAKV